MTHVVFVGPTLPAALVRQELDAQILPPAAQGDVYLAAREEPAAIGLIDGYFERVPAVWHKEILWALQRGIRVWGSASMGALRAAELAPFGMEGVGWVYEAYATGALTDDDEVAVRHGPAESGFRILSEALVNIRCTLAAAEAEAVISPATHAALLDIGKTLFYPERSYPRLLDEAAQAGLGAEIARLRAWLPGGRRDQKRADALAMLQRMREDRAADPRPPRPHFYFENTLFWETAVRLAEERRLAAIEDNGGMNDE